MAVDIKIDLRTKGAHWKIERLRAHMETLDELDLDLDNMDFGGVADDLDKVSRKLEKIRKQTGEISDNMDFDGVRGIQVKKPSTPDGGTHADGGGTDPPAGPMKVSEFRKRAELVDNRDGFFGNSKLKDLFDIGTIRRRDTGQFTSLRKQISPAGNLLDTSKRAKDLGRYADKVGDVNRKMGFFGKTLKRLRPTMRKWWSLLALIIPLVIAWGVQALGVASAMGAVAAAGASIIGLGLLGHAEDMGAAWSQAQEQLQTLKEEMFEVFQPTMQTFAPIQAEFFDFAPGQLEKVASAMEGLVAYEDVIFAAFSGMTNWIAQAIDGMVNAEEAVSQLAMRFGALAGNAIIDFFGWLLDEATANQELLIELGAALVKVGEIIYQVSMAVSRFVIAFSPVLDILAVMAQLLNTPVIGSLLSFILVLGIVTAKVLAVMRSILLLKLTLELLGITATQAGASFAASIAASMKSAMAWIASTIASLGALRAALVATGIGALVVGAGMVLSNFMGSFSPGGPPGGGGGGGPPPSVAGTGGSGTVVNNYNSYEIRHEGDMSTGSEQRLRSTIRDVQAEDSAQATPTVSDSDSSSSRGDNN